MTPERWQKIDELFHVALACSPARLDGFLRKVCAGDQQLRLEIESLVSSHQNAESFIESPPGDLAAELLGLHEDGLKPGQQIGNYKIVRQLGSGGMGEVYLADDPRLNRKIALKVLPPHFTINPYRVHRFEREARAASALNHPNIVTIFEIGRSDNAHFIATEFVDGKTLRQLMNEEPFTLGEALNVVIQVAGALTAAHAAGIVHRDIKPENIMVRADGYVKILDFGLAKLADSAITNAELETPTLLQSSPGLVMGTVQYMSPEQARAKKVTVRTDIWSLGIVLYELLAGRVPFSGETPSHAMVSLMEDELPPLTDYANVPRDLDCIVTKALRKNQKERYQTTTRLANDLKDLKRELQLQERFKGSLKAVPSSKKGPAKSALQESSPALAPTTNPGDVGVVHPAPAAARLVDEIKRRKTPAVAAFILLVGSIVFVSWFLANRRDQNKEIDSIAVMPFINETGSADVEYLSDGITETLIGDLAQLPKLKVTARNSTFKYKGKEVDPRAAGRALGVEAILTGRILRRGANFLISVELINTRDATHIWGEQYNRKESDLAAAAAKISREITQALRFRLTPVEQQQLAKRETVNPHAYELLLKGRFYRSKGGTENFKKATECFEQAIAIDSAYALAYVELSISLAGLVTNNLLDPRVGTPKAEEAARKALDLDESLAEAHLAMASVKQDAWDWPAAEREYKRALELNPNLSRAHVGYTFYLIIHRRDEEALAEAKRARELDPLSHGANKVVVFGLILTGQVDQAIEAAKKMLELDEHNPDVHVLLGMAYRRKKQYVEAIAAYQEGIRRGDDSPDTQLLLGQAYARRGETEKARAILKELEKGRQYVSPMGFALLYASLGNYEKTLVLLESGYDARDKDLIWLNVEESFDPLRTDARFDDLLGRLGLK